MSVFQSPAVKTAAAPGTASMANTNGPTSATCVHCGQPRSPEATFCKICGKALPQLSAAPRVIRQNDIADTPAGQTLQIDMLGKQTRSAANALMFVAVIQGLVAIAVSAFAFAQFGAIGCAILWTIAVAFFGLAFWARRSPLPATICGLALFVSLHLLDAIADPSTIANGWLMKIIIIGLLVRGIQAGLKHRQLLQQVNPDCES